MVQILVLRHTYSFFILPHQQLLPSDLCQISCLADFFVLYVTKIISSHILRYRDWSVITIESIIACKVTFRLTNFRSSLPCSVHVAICSHFSCVFNRCFTCFLSIDNQFIQGYWWFTSLVIMSSWSSFSSFGSWPDNLDHLLSNIDLCLRSFLRFNSQTAFIHW